MRSHPTADLPTEPQDRLLPWHAVRAITGISRTTAWRLQNAGEFPRPVVISRGRVGWRESEIAAWRAALSPRSSLSRNEASKPGAALQRFPQTPAPPSPVRPADVGPSSAPGPQPGRRRRARGASNQIAFDF